MQVRAAVCHAFGQPLRVETVELAPPGPGQVQVRLAACAICHSDIHYLDGDWGGDLPAIFGHEAAGTVEALGPGVLAPAIGARVVVTLIRACGHCRPCARGKPVLCEGVFPGDERGPLATTAGAAIGQGMRTGAFAERVVVDASQVAVVPDDMDMRHAALLACGVITGFGAVSNTARMEPGATVAVIGAGGVGLNAIQGAALCGAARIVAVDVVAEKLVAARRFGATDAVHARETDPVAAVRAATGGRGVDYVFVTVGAGPAFGQAFDMLARGGALVAVGMPASGVTAALDPGTVAAYGQRVLGSKMGSARLASDIPMLVALYRQGRLRLAELVSGTYPLEAINEAIASSRAGRALRNVVVFDGD